MAATSPQFDSQRQHCPYEERNIQADPSGALVKFITISQQLSSISFDNPSSILDGKPCDYGQSEKMQELKTDCRFIN